MKRVSLFLSFLVINLVLSASSYAVFEKDGYFGLKDSLGKVLIPAVYDELGWTDQRQEVLNELIGYREGNLWGLISIKNKRISDAEYSSLSPFDSMLIIASKHRQNTNKLFYGLIDSKGRVKLSFNYFSIRYFEGFVEVGKYELSRVTYGLLTISGNELLKPKYDKIWRSGNFILAQHHTIDLFSRAGVLIHQAIDSVKTVQEGLICFKKGRVGFVSTTLQNYSIDYKTIRLKNEEIIALEFPEWECYLGIELIFKKKCDSLKKGIGNTWIAYLNDVEEFFLPTETISSDFVITHASEDFLVGKKWSDEKWYVLDSEAQVKTIGYDSLVITQKYLFGKVSQDWKILNTDGVAINEFRVESIYPGNEGFFIARLDGYWGLLDFNGEVFFNYKYDSIIPMGNTYLVNYLGYWGQVDKNEDWMLEPRSKDMKRYNDILVYRKGSSYSYFFNGKRTHRSNFKPDYTLKNYIVVDDGFGNKGLIDKKGKLFVPPQFKKVNEWGEFMELRGENYALVVNKHGQIVLGKGAGIQQIAGYGDDFFLVQKDKRWGFIDNEGRLRIANRYDACTPFSEGMAGVSLRGRWGYIDKKETLRVQPHYSEVSPFRKGHAVVRLEDHYKIIDENGNEKVDLKSSEVIQLETGNYLIKNSDGLVGLANSEARIILRTGFDAIEDYGDYLITSRYGLKGVIHPNGVELFPMVYKDADLSGGYILVRK